MKQLIIFLVSLLLSVCAHAQTDSFYVYNKWASRKDTLVLFNGGNNVIQVYNKSMKPATYKLKSLDKSLRIGAPEIKNDTMSVMAMPYAGKAKKMRLAIINSKTQKTIKTLEFVSDSIPKPQARLGTLKGAEAPKKNILEQLVLKLDFPNSLYAYPYRILSYSFRHSSATGIVTIPVNGFFLTNDIIKEIGATPVGGVIEFTNIRVTCPECSTRTLDDLKITVR